MFLSSTAKLKGFVCSRLPMVRRRVELMTLSSFLLSEHPCGTQTWAATIQTMIRTHGPRKRNENVQVKTTARVSGSAAESRTAATRRIRLLIMLPRKNRSGSGIGIEAARIAIQRQMTTYRVGRRRRARRRESIPRKGVIPVRTKTLGTRKDPKSQSPKRLRTLRPMMMILATYRVAAVKPRKLSSGFHRLLELGTRWIPLVVVGTCTGRSSRSVFRLDSLKPLALNVLPSNSARVAAQSIPVNVCIMAIGWLQGLLPQRKVYRVYRVLTGGVRYISNEPSFCGSCSSLMAFSTNPAASAIVSHSEDSFSCMISVLIPPTNSATTPS